jgi:uncharacterized protein YoxC/biopolymer transport protein ExbB/TolQ
MDFFTYLYPREHVAQVVVGVQILGFILWSLALIYFFIRDRLLINQVIKFNVAALGQQEIAARGSETESPADGQLLKIDSQITSNTILSRHLITLGAFGKSGRPLDVAGLVKNTTARLTVNNTWLKSTLSLFIVVGLLGTLWGLASSLDQLAAMSPDGTQITNETLAQGLNTLLGKLGGAFAPSICGVFFTVLGVLFFAIYIRAASMPLAALIERRTITYWAPGLADKKTDAAGLMQENIKAAQQIGKAAENISENIDKLVGTFNENLPNIVKDLSESVTQISDSLTRNATQLSDDVNSARSTLKALTRASENLNQFSGTFKNSVEKLYPFSDATELRALYEKLLDRSTGILENYDAFQEGIRQELSQIAEQKGLFNTSLNAFRERVEEASASIVDEIGGTSSAAKDAFLRLSEQNETVIRELVHQVGSPIATILQPIPETLDRVKGEISRINTPLEGVRDSIAASSHKVIDYAAEKMNRIEDKLQSQVTNLEALSSSINALVPSINTLSERIDGFNNKTEDFGKSIDNFGDRAAGIADKFDRFDEKADQVIKSTKVVPRAAPRERATEVPTPPKKKGFISRIKNRIFGEK